MTEYVLARTGGAPLKFVGELVREADGERFAGREQTRWYTLAVYDLGDGRFVCSAEFNTKWQGERTFRSVGATASPAKWFGDWNPTPSGIGYPSHYNYAARQGELLASLRGQYATLVGDVLDDPRFAEVLP